MESDASNIVSSKTSEIEPLNIIRVETALSRFPVHRLAKQGTVAIEIRESNSAGAVAIRWEVSHNSRYGQPGPLAYKLDTLIVNRKIEEATRPLPRIIRLGTLLELAEQLDLGRDTNIVKKSLRQNAGALITARFQYRSKDGAEQTIEADFTRYAVVFTGEKLPDGRKADAVYLALNDVFIQVINGAQTRPLDYDYLKELPPSCQRFYELLSFQIYAALKNGRRQARLSYAEFCTYAPLTRFVKWDQVRPQMARIHRPHLKSGYVESVEFEQTADRDGKPDWLMVYVPGPKAKAEFRAFNKKGGPKTLEIEPIPPALPSPPEPEPSPLERELVSRGVTLSTAAELVATFPETEIAAHLEYFDWLLEKHPNKVENPGGFLVAYIRSPEKFPPLKGFESKSDREKRQEAENAKRQQEIAEERRTKAQERRKKELDRLSDARWEAMDAEQQELCEEAALAAAAEDIKRQFSGTDLPSLRQALMTSIRRGYLRRLLAQELTAYQEPRQTA